MTRASSFNEQIGQRIVDLLEMGYRVTEVAALCSIHRSSIYEWCRRFPDFSDRVKRARAAAQITAMASIFGRIKGEPARYDKQGRLIKAEVPPDPYWAAWWLTRVDRLGYQPPPDRVGPQTRTLRAILEALDDTLLQEMIYDNLRRGHRSEYRKE